MAEADIPSVAIVDYGLGNLFSIQRACGQAGMLATITCQLRQIIGAEAIILPGVGAFGDAMESLRKLDLVSPIRDIAASGKPLLGICLGMQLLMSESYEFGRHPGLGIIDGPVVRFDNPLDSSVDPEGEPQRRLKVPQVGWNRIFDVPRLPPAPDQVTESSPARWSNSLLKGLVNGEFMYFVHSFYAEPVDSGLVLSVSKYGGVEFCSSLRRRNIFACQFHPERSGLQGLQIYRNLALLLLETKCSLGRTG